MMKTIGPERQDIENLDRVLLTCRAGRAKIRFRLFGAFVYNF